MRKKVSTTVYLTQEQVERLKRLSERTRVPVAEYVREGVDLVLEKRRGGHMEAYRVLSAEFPGDAPGNLGERISFEGAEEGRPVHHDRSG